MKKLELLVIIAFAASVYSSEVEDADQKKRGVVKGTSLNTIPSGSQKPDFTYSIYSQNSSPQSVSSNPSYQSQVPSSFYPNQASQYYSSNSPSEASSSYAPQPQYNLLPPASSSQFLPINFIPNPGFQSKYQLVPPKLGGNFQLAIFQPPNGIPTPSLAPYGQNLFAPNPASPIGSNHNYLGSFPQPGQFNIGHNLPFGNSYLGQPSAMVLVAQPNPNLYNNFLYSNPAQNLYNYFPSNAQPRFGLPYSSPSTSELQIQIPQSVPKEENEISSHTSDYTAPSDSSSYKTAYSSRASYPKH